MNEDNFTFNILNYSCLLFHISVSLRIIREFQTRPSTPLGYLSCITVHGNEDMGLGYNWQSPQQFPLPQFIATQRHRISSVTEFKFSLPRTTPFSCFRLFHVWNQKIQRLALSINGPAVTSEQAIARPSRFYVPNMTLPPTLLHVTEIYSATDPRA
jgi:hypothetical protein